MKKPTQTIYKNLRPFDLELTASGRILCGVDEAGRGPLAGPVVVGAVIVKDFSFEARIDDSKKLSAKAREIAFLEIQKKCIYAVSIISETRIDEVNIFRATLEGAKEAVENISEKPDLVLMDGIAIPVLSMETRSLVNGDGISFSVACASIVAKVTRDKMMVEWDEKYPQYGFKQHKGYGTEMHLKALKEFGPCPLHRRSFAPVYRAEQSRSFA